jgi:hypothetical protein
MKSVLGSWYLAAGNFKARRNLARPIDASGVREMSNQLPSSTTERLHDNNAACRMRNSLACSSDSPSPLRLSLPRVCRESLYLSVTTDLLLMDLKRIAVRHLKL